MDRKKKPPKFKEKFGKFACVGSTISVKVGKLTVTATIERDDDMGEPWKEHDGHGPVSDWTSRDKAPGERVLYEDRGSKRYYDWQEAIKIAKRDGWDAKPYKTGTKGQQAARAVEADFQRLRAWCQDDWCWVGVRLSVSKGGVTLDKYAASLWGIESDSNDFGDDNYDYLTEVANELLPEALEAAEKVLCELRK